MLATLAIAVGGALGAVTRYGIDRVIEHRVSGVFPWSTFVVNVSGCFLVGLVLAAVIDRHHAPSWLGLGLVTGFLGAYTTYSTFAQETYHLGWFHPGLATANVVASVIVGIAAVSAGNTLGHHL